jgi:ribosome-binding protein aMBF1 (putative translation factor)
MRIVPTGNLIKSARSIIGWTQKNLAAEAKMQAAVLNRMERSGKNSITGSLKNLARIQDVLERHGVEMFEDNGAIGVRLTRKPKK